MVNDSHCFQVGLHEDLQRGSALLVIVDVRDEDKKALLLSFYPDRFACCDDLVALKLFRPDYVAGLRQLNEAWCLAAFTDIASPDLTLRHFSRLRSGAWIQ